MQLSEYMKELRKVKTLDRAQEAKLWAAFKERGDEEARQRLIESYQPLVFKQAAPFAQLDCVLDLEEGYYLNEFRRAARGHVLATSTLELPSRA